MLVYFIMPGVHTVLAEQVRARDPEWVAPPLWRSEFRNALAGYLRRGDATVDGADRAFADAEAALFGEHSPRTPSILRLIAASNCTAYDLEFVAVAQSLGIMLVTNDKEVLAAFPDIAVSPVKFVS